MTGEQVGQAELDGEPVFVPTEPEHGPAASRRAHWLALGGIILFAVGVPVVLSLITGSWGIPHHDAWSHSKIAQRFATDGVLELVGWNRTALVGQIVVLGRLGASIEAQHTFVAILGVIGLIASHEYLRRRVTPWRAVLGTAILAATAEYGLLSTSFMSDIPAFTAALVCLVVGDRAVRRGSLPWLAVSVLVGLWGVTVREQAGAAPAAVLLVAITTWRGAARAWAAVTTGVALAAVALFESWRRGLPYGDPPEIDWSLTTPMFVAFAAVLTVSLYIAPAVLLVSRPRSWGWLARSAAVVVPAACAFVIAVFTERNVFLGNYLSRAGAYASGGNGFREILSMEVWAVLVALACVSLGLVIGLALNHGIRLDRLSAIFTVLIVMGTLAQAASGQAVSGRFLLPLLPIASAWALGFRVAPRRVLASGALALLGGVALVLTANAKAYDAARWQLASRVVEERGIPATSIDAGMEWAGYHAEEPVRRHPGRFTWSGYYTGTNTCYVVSSDPTLWPGAEVVASTDYRQYSVAGDSSLWVLHWGRC